MLWRASSWPQFEADGQEVRLIPPEYARLYVKANKSDYDEIAEAVTRPTMRFVPVKSEAQSVVQALHRTVNIGP